MKKLFFSLIALFSISMLVPMSFGDLYYNNEHSYSVQYPGDWDIEEGDYGVSIRDGYESAVSDILLWESNTSIFQMTDMGNKLSDNEEKQWRSEAAKEWCDEANNNENGYRCGSFKVISQVSGKSLDGYPTITSKFTETRKYEEFANNTPMVVVEKLIYVGDTIWIINTSTDVSKFSEYENKIYGIMNSFIYPASPPIENSSGNGGGCLIATAAYGSELSPQVQMLREIRDNQLMNTESGSAFMSGFNELYYSFSPTIADMERQSPMFKEVIKVGLTPMLSSLSLMENANSESEVISLGLSVIALNLGMYLGVPAVVVIGIRKRK